VERKKRNVAEQAHKSRFGVPNSAQKVKCYSGDRSFSEKYLSGSGDVYFWTDNANLFFAPAFNSSITFKCGGAIKIPFINIKSFSRQGDSYNEVHITGGGGGGGAGSSIKGAIVGGIIAGEAGAIIGSRKKINPINPIKTENRFIDKRQTIIEMSYGRNDSYLFFDSDIYDKLLKIIPNKEITFASK